MQSFHEKYIVDEKGKKTAVVLSFSEWKKVCDLLEEYEDIRAYDRAKQKPGNAVSFNKAIKKMKDIKK
jgi:PHD/YefM family antitoxin component YafN of YafNO toxin-antitoxin module